MLRRHTQGVVSWDSTAGESIRRVKAPVPARKPAIPGTTTDRKLRAGMAVSNSTSILQGNSTEGEGGLFAEQPDLLRLPSPVLRSVKRGASLAAA